MAKVGKAAICREWNQPVRWPAYALLGVGVLIAIPGFATFFRERQ